jgi:RimJ/RimL family protein N-acetyltransferase
LNFQTRIGERVLIREARGEDATNLLEYVNTISVESEYLTFGQGEFVMTVEQEIQFLEHCAKQANAIYLIAEIDSKIIGTATFAGGSRPRLKHVGEFGVSVLRAYWGNGIGTALVQNILDWSKQTGIIRKVDLKVRADNMSAIHVYKKLGFTTEGIQSRSLCIDGIFYDSILMGYIID